MKKIIAALKKNSPPEFTIRQWLFISSSFSLILLLVRIMMTGQLSYAFLAWNLFLGYIPFFISGWLNENKKITGNRIKLLSVLSVWLLFIPNSFYILTDLFHLPYFNAGHQWFDLTMILSFAWNGILFGILSIRQMEMLLKETKGKWISGLVICLVMWLNAFGIYIGRFLRFNSWDVFTNPFSLFSEIFNLVFDPYDHRYVWAMVFCFGSFMIIIYYTIKKLSKEF